MLQHLLRWLPLSLLLGLGGCAVSGPPLERHEPAQAIELTEVPFYPQERFQCGPAALAMVLTAGGTATEPEALTEALYIPAREGSLQPELIAQTRQEGYVPYVLEGRFEAVLAELQAGRPVLVLQNLGLSWIPRWHYAVVVGYLPESRRVVLRSGLDARRLTPLGTFLRTWQRGEHWAMVALRPGELPARGDPDAYLRAAFELERAKQLPAAARAYEAGVSRWPEHAGLSLALANILYAQDDAIAAESVLAQAIARGVESPLLYNNLAVLLSELGRHTEAEQAALRAVALGRSAEPYTATLEEVRAARNQ